MPEFCSCGAELPPDARFCHKCGRPQRPDAVAEEVEPPPTFIPPPPPPAAPPPPPSPAVVSFRNPVAVRVGLLAASLAALLSWIPFLNLGFLVWWAAAGFYAVYLYRRRTGQLLTTGGGLRLGWITGILTFAIMTVLFTLAIIPAAVSAGGLGAVFEEQIRNMPAGDPNVEEALRLFQSSAGVAAVLTVMLLMFFGLITLMCTVGGALGARIVGRQD